MGGPSKGMATASTGTSKKKTSSDTRRILRELARYFRLHSDITMRKGDVISARTCAYIASIIQDISAQGYEHVVELCAEAEIQRDALPPADNPFLRT